MILYYNLLAYDAIITINNNNNNNKDEDEEEGEELE
jgi:hypothetical protein